MDQVGSTARADGADPEDIRDWNRMYYAETRSRIEKYGGLLEKYVGDAVMAVFGVPLARTDDAERAVRAGLSILEGIRELNSSNPGLDLEVRVAICTGEAVIEVDAPPESAIATGDVVNTAARLQSSAPPGSLIVGPDTYRLTKGAFRFRAATPVEAKGKKDPIPAWIVDGIVPSSDGRLANRTPFVGRDSETLLIRTFWQRAIRELQPQLLTLVGSAGIGKSRLASETTTEVEESGGTVLWGRCSPEGQQTPYQVIAQIVRRASRIFESDTVETARQKLASFIGSLFPPDEADQEMRYLSLLTGLALDERAREPIELQFATRRLFERMSTELPTLVVFDDMHWADEASLDLVEYLSTRLRERPFVIMALARPELLEMRPNWGAGVPAHTSLSLNPLTSEEASRAVSGLFPHADETTIARVVQTADGNPLFIEELVASIQDDTTDRDLPPTIRAVVAARIDALPPEPRLALLHASVIGKSFWRGVLEQLGGVSNIDTALDALEMRGLIQRQTPSRVEGDSEFSFKHDLILESAYATLPRASRRDLHLATATALESLAQQPVEIAPILAHHLRQGGDTGRARGYLLKAAERALGALAVEETFDLYTQAIELASNDDDRLSDRLLRAQALLQLQAYSRAAQEFAELIPLLDGEQEIEALLGRADATLWTEQTEETMECALKALQLAKERGFVELEPVALGLVGYAHGMRGEAGDLERAVRLGDEALRIWQPNARQRELAEHYHLAANQYYWLGDYDRAMQATRSAAATAGVELHSQEFRLRGAGMQGIILSATGRYEDAISAAEYAIELARDMGRAADVVINYSTLALREIYALDQALACSEEVADRLGPSDFNMPWMNARADLFTARVMKGDLSIADASWDSLWEDSLASKAWERWLVSGRIAAVRAEMDLAMGRVADAQTWARRAIGMAVASNRKKYEAIARTTLGRALTAAGLSNEAVVELRSAVATADSLGSPLLQWQARATLADALAASGADPISEYTESTRIIRSIADGLSPLHAAGFLGAPPVLDVLEAAG